MSLREGQIRRLEQRGGRGARTAALARNPNRFLSAVQIGVTVAGFFSAAYGASTIAPAVSPALVSWGLPAAAASITALVGTTLVIATHDDRAITALGGRTLRLNHGKVGEEAA